MKPNTIYGRLIIFLALILVSSVSAAQWSASQDGFEIRAPDITCTGTECWVPVTVCNLEEAKGPYNVSLFVHSLQPFAMYEWDEQQYTDYVFVHNDTVSVNSTTGLNETDHTGDYLGPITRTRYAWVPAKEFTIKKDSLLRNQAEAANLNFGQQECKEFVVGVHNIIGDEWKYDVNFLDPFINSTNYEIGNLSNNTNTWNVDMNSTTSTVSLSSDNKTFTLGTDSVQYRRLYFNMTSYTTPAPYIVNDTTSTSSTERGWKAFDSVDTTSGVGWYGLMSAGPALSVYLGAANSTAVMRYAISCYTNYMPKNFTFEGSNDNSTWTVLDNISQTNCSSTSAFNNFTISNTNKYLYYKINITASTHSTYISLEELALYSGEISYNTSKNVYRSVPINTFENISTITPTWNAVTNGGSASVNITCDADSASPSWTGSVTNGSLVPCPVSGDSFMYEIQLSGNNTNSPVVQNFTAEMHFAADEETGRAAILAGVASSSAASSYSAYADQQVYLRLANGTQSLGRYDYFVVSGNRRYAFNYDKNSSNAFPVSYNITPVFYVWQRYNLTSPEISTDVEQLINSTY